MGSRLLLLFGIVLAQAAQQPSSAAALRDLSECPSRTIARTEKWKEAFADREFVLQLPEGFEPVPTKERYMHGGQQWARGTVKVEMVWGMWGRSSFQASSVPCKTEIARVPAMLIRPKVTDRPHATVWYMTGTVHEPLVTAWSSEPGDATLVEAIIRAGSARPAK
jgi:hypothetical protein